MGGELPLRLRVDGPRPAGLRIRFTLYARLASRSAFEATTRGEALGSALTHLDVPFDDQPAFRNGEVLATLRLRGPSSPSNRDLLPATHTGVYPMRVDLVDPAGGGAIPGFITWVVAVEDAPVDTPLAVSWIWQVAAAPLDRADGSPETEVRDEMAPGGRLDRIAGSLAEAAGLPLTLAIGPETIESWRDAAREEPLLDKGYEALRAGASRAENQLLPSPYVPIDVPSIEAAGLGGELVSELIAGNNTLERVLGRRIDPRTAFVDPVNAPALDLLRRSFVDRVVVREESLVPAERNLTAAIPFTLAQDSIALRAAATNPGIYALLDGNAPRALRAQRFLAGISLVALETPSLPRGLVFATPSDWDPDPALTNAVLDGLRHNPLLDPQTLDSYFAKLPDDTFDNSDEPLVRLIAPAEPAQFPTSLLAFADARLDLESFRSVVGADDRRIRRGARSLLLALTTSWSSDRTAAELSVIDASASEFLGRITTTARRVTLTSRRAEVPLSFRNETGRTVRVRISLAGSKLLFPEGADKTVELAEGNTTERFLIEARANGTFTMSVTLTSEDGRLPVGSPTLVTVRSTVFSGVGAFLTIGALLFLAGWWANHIWRTRRARRADPASSDTSASY